MSGLGMNVDPWKLIFASAAGTSHTERDLPCQDATHAQRVETPAGMFLVLSCADGAGSAQFAEQGAAAASAAVVEAVAAALAQGASLDEQLLRDGFAAAHRAVLAMADLLQAPPRELSSTLLLAVLGPDSCGFAQVGDGVIVYREQAELRHVFWPDNGEYSNTTYFVSAPSYVDRLQCRLHPTAAAEVALMTDGLQNLALRLAEKAVHAPFFEPMFQSLRQCETTEQLVAPLQQFLNSPAVNARTDDDKTLMLATRAEPAAIDHVDRPV